MQSTFETEEDYEITLLQCRHRMYRTEIVMYFS